MKLRPFELALVVIFLLLMAAALFLLKTYRPNDNNGQVQIGKVEVWGTLPKDGMEKIIQEKEQINETYRDVTYRQIEPSAFTNEFVNALAEGKGPDVLLLSSEQLVTLRSKLRPISYEAFPKRDIASQYVDGAQIFALFDGLYAYPLMLDPLMLYWNKDELARENILEAPATWEALVNEYVPTLTKRASDRTIEKSAIALGEYENIRNAYSIVSALLLQAGSYGVTETEEGQYVIRLNESPDGFIQPLRVTTDFYTRFSRPDNTLYSWNRSFPSDRDRFVSGDLALYFGQGSEAHELERLNPNLSFDIAEIPQGAASTVRRTYANFYGLALVRNSDNLPGAALVLQELSAAVDQEKIAAAYNMVPALRSVVARGSNDTYGRIMYKSAAIAFGWLSPARPATDEILKNTMRDVLENRSDSNSAVNDALQLLEIEYNK
ncbi:MAG: ABC transporter substrate-binding protein [Patescibacteria group bacterium]